MTEPIPNNEYAYCCKKEMKPSKFSFDKMPNLAYCFERLTFKNNIWIFVNYFVYWGDFSVTFLPKTHETGDIYDGKFRVDRTATITEYPRSFNGR